MICVAVENVTVTSRNARQPTCSSWRGGAWDSDDILSQGIREHFLPTTYLHPTLQTPALDASSSLQPCDSCTASLSQTPFQTTISSPRYRYLRGPVRPGSVQSSGADRPVSGERQRAAASYRRPTSSIDCTPPGLPFSPPPAFHGAQPAPRQLRWLHNGRVTAVGSRPSQARPLSLRVRWRSPWPPVLKSPA